MAKKIKFFLPLIFTFFLFIIFYFKRFFIIKIYPPTMNLFIFLIFFSSMFCNETIIQKMARMWEGNLEEKALIYTRKLTGIWCIFLFFNFLISLTTVFMSDKIWFIYNGFISYFLVGSLFIIEYCYRFFYKRRNNLLWYRIFLFLIKKITKFSL